MRDTENVSRLQSKWRWLQFYSFGASSAGNWIVDELIKTRLKFESHFDSFIGMDT